jgi:hypothetical protein
LLSCFWLSVSSPVNCGGSSSTQMMTTLEVADEEALELESVSESNLQSSSSTSCHNSFVCKYSCPCQTEFFYLDSQNSDLMAVNEAVCLGEGTTVDQHSRAVMMENLFTPTSAFNITEILIDAVTLALYRDVWTRNVVYSWITARDFEASESNGWKLLESNSEVSNILANSEVSNILANSDAAETESSRALGWGFFGKLVDDFDSSAENAIDDIETSVKHVINNIVTYCDAVISNLVALITKIWDDILNLVANLQNAIFHLNHPRFVAACERAVTKEYVAEFVEFYTQNLQSFYVNFQNLCVEEYGNVDNAIRRMENQLSQDSLPVEEQLVRNVVGKFRVIDEFFAELTVPHWLHSLLLPVRLKVLHDFLEIYNNKKYTCSCQDMLNYARQNSFSSAIVTQFQSSLQNSCASTCAE